MNDLKPLEGWGEAADKMVGMLRDVLNLHLEPKRIVGNAKAEAEAIEIVSTAEIDAHKKKSQTMVEQFELIENAKKRFLAGQIYFQKNLEEIGRKSFPFLNSDSKPENIDEGFVHRFAEAAKGVSEEELQNIWAKILATEANNAGSFSYRTLESLKLFSKDEALLFQRFANYVLRTEKYSFFLDCFEDDAKREKMTGLSYTDMLCLTDMGIIDYNDNSLIVFSPNVTTFSRIFYGTKVVLINNPSPAQISLPKVKPLSTIGRELFLLQKPQENNEYYDLAIKSLDKLKLTLEQH